MGDMTSVLLRIPIRFPYPLNIFELNFVFSSVLLADAQLYVRRENDRLDLGEEIEVMNCRFNWNEINIKKNSLH